ncbi:MAG TPA: hypothetical protein VKY73_09165 [Polyangiaceae bacterium]|nr:hypothetical protein [Polyangiaceae bacterium]
MMQGNRDSHPLLNFSHRGTTALGTPILLVGLLVSTIGCSSNGGDEANPSGGAQPGTGGQGAAPAGGSSGGALTTGGTGGGMTGGATGGTASSGAGKEGTSATGGAAPSGGSPAGGTPGGGMAGAAAGNGDGDGGTDGGEPGKAGAGGQGVTAGAGAGGQGGVEGGGAGGQGGVEGQAGAQNGGAGGGGDSPGACEGKAWATADPTKAGPFQVTAEKNVGPLAGVVPDPIYGNEQQRFNVYRPANLEDSGYCHPILIWANGYRDNPEQNPPDCVVNQASNQWCGQYLPMLNHLASHGFVVVAPLSTATAEGDPLPTIAGLDWILEEARDPSSPYYQRLDTDNIGQLGHSYGGMSTCMSASDPRYKALATICGTRALTGVHTPMLFFCGGKDTTVSCSGVRNTFLTVTDQPAFFINELNADHGSWVYQGANGVSLSSAAAWFRVHLMNDTANRKYFYGANCVFCNDNRVEVEQNSLMLQ